MVWEWEEGGGGTVIETTYGDVKREINHVDRVVV
jgi:hypothetical protein